jgi:tRNA(fMet)-specific endonuclease VapC
MPRYMLDTDTCSCIMKRSSEAVLKRLRKLPVSDVCITCASRLLRNRNSELSPRRQHDEAALIAFLSYIEVLEFPDEASFHYAKIRAELKVPCAMIGANDRLIAAHARSLGLTLVTNNTREFGRVRHLAIENWTSRT